MPSAVTVAIMTRNPSTFEEYQYGTSHRGSVSSVGDRSVHFNEEEGSPSASTALLDVPPNQRRGSNDQELRRRRQARCFPIIFHKLIIFSQVVCGYAPELIGSGRRCK